MAVVTATQVTSYTDISASAATVTASGLIPIVQDRIGIITNNYFTTEIYGEALLTFNATARTIVATSLNWETEGFADGDEIFIYQSYRNDGYYEVSSVSGGTLTLVTGESVVAEKSGISIIVSMVQWPSDVSYAAAQMVKFDYDDRKQRTGVTSHSLGPFSESFAEAGMFYGYPDDIINALMPYRIVSMR
jgi:hypothetical protein